MHRFTVQSLIALNLVVCLSLGMAAAPAVGIVTARGSFTIDNASIAGNATLFEGNHIETGKASSQLQLNTGARMQLAAESRGIVYRDRLVLEQGTSSLENAGNFQVEARSLRIRPASDNAGAQVSLRSGVVEVAALNGPVRVTTANGVLLANLYAGRMMSFEPQEAASASATTVTGCLESSSGKFLLTDEASLVRFEIMGAGTEKEVGHRVQIAGTVTAVSDSVNQVHSTSVKQLSKKCSNRGKGAAAAGVGAAAGAAGAAGAGGTGGAAGGAAAGGIGAAIASHAVIAGVIVAGAATAAAVAVVKRDSSSPETTISPSAR